MKPSLLPNCLLKAIILVFLGQFCHYSALSQTKTVGLTKHFNGTQENGYVLFSPLNSDTTFLIDKCGKKVHQWVSEYTPGLSVYLKPNGNLMKTGTYTDTVFGSAGGRGGIIEEFDWNNNLVWRYKVFNDSLCQHHDITPLPNGNVLVLAWHSISKTAAMALGRDAANFSTNQTELWGERIIELKPIGKDSAEVVWYWDLYDHIVQDNNPSLPNYGVVSQNPQLMNINYAITLKTADWIHANSLDYNEQLDQIVISAHNIGEIWIIDHSTSLSESKGHSGGNFNRGGDILYRWGNPAAYNRGSTSDRKLFRQHNANWIPGGYRDSGCIMIFNNGWERDTAYSSIDVIKPPLMNGLYNPSLPYLPANLTWQYKDSVPTRFYSQIISGAHRLPNGNTLICSGVQGRLFEVTYQKKTVWEYKNPVSGINLQTDGEKAENNAVFRCHFYPDSYSAFKNRDLSQKGTIEKNSYIYSCNYETTPPKILSVTPKKADTGIVINPTLQIAFDEAVLAMKTKIKIFQNGVLHETISTDSSQVSISNKTAFITVGKPFSYNSKISVLVPVNSFRDSSNNYAAKIDSSAWFFYTKKKYTSKPALLPAHLSNFVKVNSTLQLLFSETISKATSGNIKIYEDGVLKQTIPVTNSIVAVSGSNVTITPAVGFNYGVTVSVVVDECFVNNSGYPNKSIGINEWTFNTVSKPVVMKLTPSHQSVNVSINTNVLSAEFDRKMYINNIGYIYVYENDFLKDSMIINGPRVSLMGNVLSFDMNSDFVEYSRIAVKIGSNLLKDSVGTAFNGLDTTQWNFMTDRPSSISKTKVQDQPYHVYPNPGKGLFTINGYETIESIVIFDMNGRKVEFEILSTEGKSAVINLRNVVPGQYNAIINNNTSVGIVIQ